MPSFILLSHFERFFPISPILVGPNINDSEKSWTPWDHMPLPRGNIHAHYHDIETLSPLKPLGQSKPNFM